MKNLIIITICLFGYAFTGNAQIDESKTTVKVPGELLRPQTGNEPSSILRTLGNHSLSTKKGIFTTNNEPIKLGEKEEKTFSMTTDNGLMTYKLDNYTPKAFTKDKEAKEAYGQDQYLGDFITKGTYVELYCRDHEYVDGDKVKILVNGEVIHHNISLGASYSPILVKLNSGLNTIEFQALNQGTSGPNTAELRVFDEQGLEVTRKEWNLLTGATANLVVVKQ